MRGPLVGRTPNRTLLVTMNAKDPFAFVAPTPPPPSPNPVVFGPRISMPCFGTMLVSFRNSRVGRSWRWSWLAGPLLAMMAGGMCGEEEEHDDCPALNVP